MATQRILLNPIPPEAAARVLDAAAFGDRLVTLTSVGYQGEDAWRFRYALSFLSPALEVERFVWLDSLPHDGAFSSGWSEGNFRLATGPDARIGVTSKTGRGVWLRAGPDALELVAIHDAKLERENPDDLATHLPATPAWNERGEWMGVAPSRSKSSSHVICSKIVVAQVEEGLPTTWRSAGESGATVKAAGLWHPWVHQVTSLPDGRWLLGIATDGSFKSAYPSKSIGFRYAIVDIDGRELGVVDHAAAAAQAPINVYEKVKDAIFPSSYHPFYPMHLDAKHGRLLHKLRNQLVAFDLDGKWMGSVDFSGKGLAGLKPFLLRAVLPSGEAIFVHEQDRTLWSVELEPLDSLGGRLRSELEAYRREIKRCGGAPLALAQLDGVDVQVL